MPEPGVPPAQGANKPGAPAPLVPELRWRRVFPGEERQLGLLRRWLASLLPDCPERADVLSVATELGSNAVQHTLSGRGAWFAVEVTLHQGVVRVAVADCGGPAEPQVVNDPRAERGRGLLLVHGLSVRMGTVGDHRGRLVWADVTWPGQDHRPTEPDPYQTAVRDAEAALARRFAGVPAWFGRSTLAWWAVAGPEGLVSAPTAQELAGLLQRLLGAADTAQSSVCGQVHHRGAGDRAAPAPRRWPGGGQVAAHWMRPGAASASRGRGLPVSVRRRVMVA
ncbi:MAG TPA: ATP-binding protein [Streptosporangiaceae bacterium]|nr:ATP-binding protein [Streptosporangiaceae bacterium]